MRDYAPDRPTTKRMPLNRTTKAILTVLFLVFGIWLSTNRQFYTAALASAFFSFALANVIILHLRLVPKWLDAALILGGTILLSLIDIKILHFPRAVLIWLSFAGLTSVLVFGVRTIWAKEKDQKLLFLGFAPAFLFVASEYFAGNLLGWTADHHSLSLDLYLFSFDSSLGVQIPFLAGQLFSHWPWLRLVAVMFYLGLPIPIALIYAGRLLRYREKAIPSAVAFLAAGPIGIIFYNLFPAAGPVHVFAGMFPWHTLPMSQAVKLVAGPIPANGPPNAIPSLHMAWVLLAWWYSRGLSWWERSVALTFVFFTVLATLGTGEHYFIDLIVAFPYALLIESMCSYSLKFTDRRRSVAVVVGLICTLGWLDLLYGALHFFWISPVLPWSFCIATVAISLMAERNLQQPKTAPAIEAPAISPVLSSTS